MQWEPGRKWARLRDEERESEVCRQTGLFGNGERWASCGADEDKVD